MLSPGARIAVVTPSGNFDPALLDSGLAIARGWGYHLDLLPGVGRRHRYLAGTDADRGADLVSAFSGEWDAVWAVRGGYGVARLLPDLPWESFARVPLIGFSDLTPLLNSLAARGRPAVHGPVLHSLARSDAASQEHLRRLLAGEATDAIEGRTLVEGEVEAPLLGGNLCVLASLCGTPWQVRARGAILLLEEIGEAPYKVDRLVTQLVQAGCLDGVAGVALGEFQGCDAPAGAGWTLDEALHDLFAGLGVPVVAGLPIGHGARNRAVPIGGRARIGRGRLELA